MRIAYAVPSREEYGFGRYLRLLLAGLSKVDAENEYFLYAIGDAARDIRPRPARTQEIALPARRPLLWWRQSVLARACLEKRIDLVHFHTHSTWMWKPLRTVVTLHHVTYAYPPEESAASWIERRYDRWLYRRIARTADAILAVSANSAGDFQRLLGVGPPRVTVAREAADPSFRPASGEAVLRVRRRYDLQRPYFFFGGSLGIRKNIPGMIRAFEKFNPGRGFEFVIAGARPDAVGYRAVDATELQAPGVRLLGFVPDEDMPALYTGAAALLYVTHYEGFGLPILEAFACGCPVVASTTASSPEIAGDAALLVKPGDDDALVAALGRAIAERDALIERGFRRVREFSWERTARETLEVYRRVGSMGS